MSENDPDTTLNVEYRQDCEAIAEEAGIELKVSTLPEK